MLEFYEWMLQRYFVAWDPPSISFHFDEELEISQTCAIFAENVVATTRKTSQCVKIRKLGF